MELRWVEPRSGPDHEWIWPPVLLAGLLIARFEAWLPQTFALLCPLKSLSGIPCPSCGTTRALRALGSLELYAALAWNPLATVGALLALGFSLYAVIAIALRTRRLRVVGLGLGARAALVLVVLLNWAWLVLDGR